MSKQLANKWRKSASLILLAKHNSPITAKKFDYTALLFTRDSKSSFLPNSSVFPGGVAESFDAAAADWLKHFKKFGFELEQLQRLAHVSGPRPSLLSAKSADSNILDNAISLRITAIRETFEEVGVLICRDRRSLDATGGYAHYNEKIDRVSWQHRVHNDGTQFLRLCQELDVVPDIWSLHEWSAWLTPSTFKKRFETAFYLVTFQQTPNVIIEANEVTDYAWRTPLEYLKAALNKELWLPVPQFYELSRLLHFTELEELLKFAKERQTKGIVLTHPVQCKCNDGFVHLLPGDDLYPSEPDASPDFIQIDKSIAEFRAEAKRLHRSEHLNQYVSTIQQNFDYQDGHLRPLDALAFKN